MEFSGGRALLTPFFHQVLVAAKDHRADLVIIDTVADTFGGNHNDPWQARQFVQMALGGLARKIGGSALACAHPSRPGQGSGEGDGYSVQWDAAFRSRLYFARPEKAETEDASARILSRKAANYGPRNATIQLRWQEGLFVPPAGGLLGSIKKRSTERIFVERLGQV